MYKRILGLLVLVISSSAFAADNNMLSFKPEVQRGDIYNPKGLWPMLGIGMGVMDHNDTARTGGLPGHVKVLGTYYFDTQPWVADLGLGLHNEFLTQNGGGSDTIQSLYSELAARYIFSNRWQLGAIWNTLIDNGHRYQSNNDNLASFIGAQALKEFAWKDAYIVRLGGRAMTSVGMNGGSINTVMAELEVSFGPGNKTSPVAEAPPAEVKPMAAAIAPHLADQAMKNYQMDPKLVHFDSNSAKLVRGSEAYFKRLARVLADNHQLFDKVVVIGYADQRGTDKYNYKLSERRAKAVSDKLIAAGVRSTQIMDEGKGKSDLLSHSMAPSALLLNRRVRFEFQGVKNQAALKNIIDAVAR